MKRWKVAVYAANGPCVDPNTKQFFLRSRARRWAKMMEETGAFMVPYPYPDGPLVPLTQYRVEPS